MEDHLRPRESRSSVIIRALVHTASGKQAERRVRNLSRAGACIDHDGELASGDTITIDIGSIKGLGGEVIWARDKVVGVRFAEQIDINEARKPRGTGIVVATGWLADLKDAYR